MRYGKGYLYMIIGPMFSGKSTHLINQIRKFRSIGCKILIIKHSLDQRYNTGVTKISSHNMVCEDCITCDNLNSILNNATYKEAFKAANIIAIEEAQFFTDLENFTKFVTDVEKKYLIVCGLNGDFRRKPFGEILNLIPLANEVIQCHALCDLCKDGTKGDFTSRKNCETDDENNQINVIGEKNIYIPVCREHFNVLNKQELKK